MRSSGERGFARVTAEIVTFDGQVRTSVTLMRPDRYRHIEALDNAEPRIVRGGGYSYAALSFDSKATVLDNRAFDRILSVDETAGVLECEAGVSLGKLHDVLGPRGFYLPVQPGYPLITLGGCIAADVHGKNQYLDGNLRNHLLGLRLYHPRHGILEVDPSRDQELFDLTCGGLGLTGHILSARIQLARLPGLRVLMRRVSISRLADTLPELERAARESAFAYTWHDFATPGAHCGRGFLYTGDFLPGSRAHANPSRMRILDATSRGRLVGSLLNRWTTSPFNRAYRAVQALGPREQEVSLFDFLFPVARRVLYFELFGHAGFHESQLLLPREAFLPFCAELERRLRTHPVPITLASCKLFRGASRHLTFEGNGVSIALDFPHGKSAAGLLHFLDEQVQRHRGLPNIAKDSRLPADVVKACYPGYETFRDALIRFDPRRIYRSETSERLQL